MENSVKFSDCNCEYLENQFGLYQLRTNLLWQDWQQKSMIIDLDEFNKKVILQFQDILLDNVTSWNEIELIEYFIGPILSLVNFNTKKFKIFSERKIQGIVEGIELYGEPDAVIATGRWRPELPYFCFNEYKKQEENKGDAAGQALAAMLVAQELTEHKFPIYGIYVVGKYWNFIVLKEKEYCISKTFNADDEEIFDIFKMLKALKEIILSY